MSSEYSLAKRLSRGLESVLERVTRQSGRLSHPPVYGSLLLGRGNDTPAQRRLRVQVILTVFIVAVNTIGVALALLFATVAFPQPSVFTDVPWWLPAVVAPVYILGAVVVGTWRLHARTLTDLRWATEGKAPTRADQRNTMLTPWRVALTHLVLWGLGTALLTTLYGLRDPAFIPRVGLVLAFCGLVVSTTSYLAAEFALRPVAAAALVAGKPPRGLAPGIMGRLMTVWMLGSGVPVLGICFIAVFSLILRDLSQRQLAVAVLITAIVSLVVGFILMWISAWLTATPVRVVRSALKRVEQGDLDSEVVVFDGTELGELQRGFNTMVEGLRERERVRDLFGRHVGREVAAAAEETLPRLGGEERHVAVLFIDIVGSTKMVTSLPPIEVVELLNRFFSVIVEEVDRNEGLVNKFEGDAALAVFGAPVELDCPEDNVLSATRAIVRRLRQEVPECPARIGVGSGVVVAGNVGARERFEYTVIGEPVNEAARLAELARSEPSRALASAGTVAAASEREQRFWRLGKPVRLRGYDERVQIASLIGSH
jgi:adenylate cyclase